MPVQRRTVDLGRLSASDRPEGLLSHETFLMSLLLRSSGGTGFWHETYRMRGGIEAIYDDVPKPIGLARFAPLTEGARRHVQRSPSPRRPRRGRAHEYGT
jgi:Domain of unknown function (DUF4188)